MYKLKKEQIEFYRRWQTKVDIMTTDSLESYIDKYTLQYVVYSSLCDGVFATLKQRGKGILSADRNSVLFAIDIVSFLEPKTILHWLAEHGCNDDIDTIRLLLHERSFNFSSDKNGNPQPNVDSRIAMNMTSADVMKKAVALMEMLYYVRYGLLQERNDIQSYKQLVLKPAISILNSMNALIFQVLSEKDQ
jgi:hypothetical protein